MIVTLKGGSFQIDEADWSRLKHLPWRVCRQGKRGAVTRQIKRGGKVLNICIYHDVLSVSPSRAVQVDHINRDPLDNRRANLRLCTASQNNGNRPPRNGMKGVFPFRSRFRARIKVEGRTINLGGYATACAAARAYDASALEHFGEFAWLNRDHFMMPTAQEV
jgi:hypothetical protein